MKNFKNYIIHIKNVIYSLFAYIAILICIDCFANSRGYNIFLTLIYFIILYFFYKVPISKEKRNKRFSCILSIILSCFLSIGNIVYPAIWDGAVHLFTLRNIFYIIICFVGLFLLFIRIFSIMFAKIDRVNLFGEERSSKFCSKGFFIVIAIILICWIPYFLRFYPAIMSPDSYYVINYVENGILSDFHTFGHTWFFGIFFLLGKALFKNLNIAVAFSIIIQMIIMASIFSYAIMYLYRRGLNNLLTLLCIVYYALSPLHAHYSITLWRDVIFGGAFVLLFITLLDIVISGKKLKKSALPLLIVSLLFILFFRNNGIYICIMLLPFILFSKFNKKKLISIIYICVLCFYFIIKGPIFDYFNIAKSTTVEAFSIPLQQIARTIAQGNNLDDESTEYLSKIMDFDQITIKYKSATADPIKTLTNNGILSKTKTSFFKVWIKNLIKYPIPYIEAYLSETLGYWYPNTEYGATGTMSKSIFDNLEVRNTPITPESFNKFIDMTTSRKIPLCNLVWSVGTTTFILIIAIFIMIYKKNAKYLLPYIPLCLLLISILLSTPVFCELRYVYGLFTCVPLLLVIPFSKFNNNGDNNIKIMKE